MSIKTKIDFSLVMPCFNEADNLPGLLKINHTGYYMYRRVLVVVV